MYTIVQDREGQGRQRRAGQVRTVKEKKIMAQRHTRKDKTMAGQGRLRQER